MKQFLIYCKYDYSGWQGTDEADGYFLVTADDFCRACVKLYHNIGKLSELPGVSNPRDFENRTLE